MGDAPSLVRRIDGGRQGSKEPLQPSSRERLSGEQCDQNEGVKCVTVIDGRLRALCRAPPPVWPRRQSGLYPDVVARSDYDRRDECAADRERRLAACRCASSNGGSTKAPRQKETQDEDGQLTAYRVTNARRPTTATPSTSSPLLGRLCHDCSRARSGAAQRLERRCPSERKAPCDTPNPSEMAGGAV